MSNKPLLAELIQAMTPRLIAKGQILPTSTQPSQTRTYEQGITVIDGNSLDGIFTTGKPILVLEAGVSINGKIHMPEVIKEGLNSNAFGGETLCFIDHLFEDNSSHSVKDLIGRYSNFRYGADIVKSDGEITEGLVADLILVPTKTVKEEVVPLLEAQLLGLFKENAIGPSVDCWTSTVPVDFNGANLDLVVEYKKLNSIDLVVRPSAGAASVLIREQARNGVIPTGTAGNGPEGGAMPGTVTGDPAVGAPEAVVEPDAAEKVTDPPAGNDDDKILVSKSELKEIIGSEVKAALAERDHISESQRNALDELRKANIKNPEEIARMLESGDIQSRAKALADAVVAERDAQPSDDPPEGTSEEALVDTAIGRIPVSLAHTLRRPEVQ